MSPERSEYAFSAALRARLLGLGLVAVAALVAVVLLVTWLLPVSHSVEDTVVSVLVVLSTVVVVGLGLLVGVRHWVVRLDATGYRVRAIRSARGSGRASAARWTDVLDVRTGTLEGARCVVLRLRDGRTTTLPVDVIEGSSTALVQELSDRLDRGHGYRRVG